MDTLPETDSFDPTISGPEDLADDLDAATVNTGLQGLGNRTRYLRNRLGVTWLVDMTGTTESAAAMVQQDDSEPTFIDAIKTELAAVETLAGDIIEVDITCLVHTELAGTEAHFRLAQSVDAGTLSEISGARVEFDDLGADRVPITLTGLITSASAGTTHIWIQSCSPGGVTEAYIDSPYVARVRHYRGV